MPQGYCHVTWQNATALRRLLIIRVDVALARLRHVSHCRLKHWRLNAADITEDKEMPDVAKPKKCSTDAPRDYSRSPTGEEKKADSRARKAAQPR